MNPQKNSFSKAGGWLQPIVNWTGKLSALFILCGLGLLVSPQTANAAIALVDGSTTASAFSGTSTSLLLTNNLTVSASANTLVVVIAFRNNSSTPNEAPPTLNWTNTTTTNVLTLAGQVDSSPTGGGGRCVAIYYTNNPTSGSGFNISGKLSGQTGSSGDMVAYTLSGVDTTLTPLFASYGSSADVTAITNTVSGIVSNSWAAVAACNYNVYTNTFTATNGGVATGTSLVANSSGGFSSASTATLGYISGLAAGSDLFTYTMSASAAGGQSMAELVFAPTDSAPAVVNQPQPVPAYPGKTVSFSVTVNGATPLSYFWRTNGVIIGADGGSFSGSATATLNINPVFTGMPTNYDVVITNSYGSVTSSVALLTVSPIGVVDQTSTNLFNGTSLLLTTNLTVSASANTLVVIVTARGGTYPAAPTTLNWTNSTATNVITLAGPEVNPGNNNRDVAIYYAYNPTSGSGFNISGGLDSGSSGVMLAYTLSGVNTNFAPLFGTNAPSGSILAVTNPISGVVSNSFAAVAACTLGNVTTTLNAANNGVPSGVPVLTTAFFNFSSTSTGTMGYIANLAAGTNVFTFTISTAGGEQSMAEAIFSPPSPPSPPTVSVQPQSVWVYPGQPRASFSVTTAGTMPFSYFWRTNGVIIGADGGSFSGSATATLNISPILKGFTNYDVVITNIAGSVTSSVALLTIMPSSGSYFTNVLALNPVAYWPLDETNSTSSGTAVAADAASTNNGLYQIASSNAWNGISGPQNADGYPQFAAGQGALGTVNGLNNSFVTTPPLNLNTNTVTIMMWVYPNNTNQAANTGLFMDRNNSAPNDDDGVGYDTTGKRMGYSWNTNQSATYNYAGGPVIPTNIWSLLAYVMSPSNTVFYCINTNGTTMSINTLTNYTEAWSGTASPDPKIDIGNDASFANGGRTFNGRIDEVAVFNYDLTSNQLQKLAFVMTANPAVYARAYGTSLKISVTNLLANTSDSDLSAMVSLVSVAGGLLTNNMVIATTTNGSTIYYTTDLATPYVILTPTNNLAESFAYVIADTFAAPALTATNLITVNVTYAAGSTNANISITPGIFGTYAVTTTWAGVVGDDYWVQRDTNDIGSPVWYDLYYTNDVPGVFSFTDKFSDLDYIPSQAYYRLRSAP